jgi:hypothetical protein
VGTYVKPGQRPNKAIARAESAVRIDRYADGSEFHTSAIDAQVQLIQQAARMADAEDPDLRAAGLRSLRRFAAASLGAEMLPQVESQMASNRARKVRPRTEEAQEATPQNVRAFMQIRGYFGKGDMRTTAKYEVAARDAAEHFKISVATVARRLKEEA